MGFINDQANNRKLMLQIITIYRSDVITQSWDVIVPDSQCPNYSANCY